MVRSAWKAAWVFRVSDQASVDPERVEDVAKGTHTSGSGIVKPGVNGLASRVDDGGESPVHELTEPSDKRERFTEMA